MAIELLNQLNAHRHWANEQVLMWMGSLPQPFPKAVQLMAHILLAEKIWLSRLKGEATPKSAWEEPAFGELLELLASHQIEIQSWLNSDLCKIFHYKRINGDPDSSSLQDILMHLCTHGIHHRAQIASSLNANTEKVSELSRFPVLDFIVFARLPG